MIQKGDVVFFNNTIDDAENQFLIASFPKVKFEIGKRYTVVGVGSYSNINGNDRTHILVEGSNQFIWEKFFVKANTFAEWLGELKTMNEKEKYDADVKKYQKRKKEKIEFARHCMMKLVTKYHTEDRIGGEISSYDIMRINEILKEYE